MLALLLFALGLNLSGVFELGAGMTRLGALDAMLLDAARSQCAPQTLSQLEREAEDGSLRLEYDELPW